MTLRQAQDEREDVIAYLERRRDNAATMEANSAEFAFEGRLQRRVLDVAIADLRAGMHEGAAQVRARLLAGAGEPG